MHVTVVNASKTVADDRVLEVIRAVNRQIRDDFAPHWYMSATLRLEGNAKGSPRRPRELLGDAILYLLDEPTKSDIEGYHERFRKGVPYGIVYTSIAHELQEDWSATFSHEALELIVDPSANSFVSGPKPEDRREVVFHWLEVCDAVQTETYVVDTIEVSNFVLPAYFTKPAKAARTSFLNHGPLEPFGVRPGGYIGYFDPVTRKTFTYQADEVATARRHIRKKAGRGRRSARYIAFRNNAG